MAVDWYQELGELIDARGKAWFPSSMQAALQQIFHYDFLLLLMFEKHRNARIVCSDFRHNDAVKLLSSLQKEAYVIDPVFRLFAHDCLKPGVFDVADLASDVRSLPALDTSDIDHLLQETNRGGLHQLKGWPDHIQETSIIVPISATNVVSISLYNAGLDGEDYIDPEPLRTVFPAISSVVRRHFETAPWPQQDWADIGQLNALSVDPAQFAQDQIRLFFSEEINTLLTEREAQLFAKLFQGMTAAAAAEQLGMSLNTAKTHRRNVYRRIGHRSVTELIGLYHSFLAR